MNSPGGLAAAFWSGCVFWAAVGLWILGGAP